MASSYRPGTFRGTKLDGVRRAKGTYLCRDCRALDERTGIKSCAMCGSRNVIYFPSKAELKRAAQLLLLEAAGKIDALTFHNRHKLMVEGIHVTTYVDDFQYFDTEKRKTVIEDSKPKYFMTDEARLKIALFNALYIKHGLTVTIVRG